MQLDPRRIPVPVVLKMPPVLDAVGHVCALYRSLPLFDGLCRARKSVRQYLDCMPSTHQCFREDQASHFAQVLIADFRDHAQRFVGVFREADLNRLEIQTHLHGLTHEKAPPGAEGGGWPGGLGKCGASCGSLLVEGRDLAQRV